MSIESRIKEIKKYFPVMKVINPSFGTGKDVVVYRGKKNLTLFLSGIDEIIKIGLFEIKVKELSENFNTVYELRNKVSEKYKEYEISYKNYSDFMNKNIKKWY